MATRWFVFVGGAIGLAVCCIVLALMWYGVSGVLYVNDTNLGHILWPSSVMLVVGWRSTVPGIMLTVSSVAINCLLYMVVAYSLWGVLRLITRRFTRR